ncbi:MAG: bifunctional glutamate N-acetyltransferase/amino-acid acetyltransferase ArgJ [Gammaproteobacteria bacterium]|jgi:glutamate N-acetyltransferase/amino-acid N-acetyltransferase
MAVEAEPAVHLLPVAGISLSATCAGIYPTSRNDIVLIKTSLNSTVSAVFTKNNFAAAPVKISQLHLQTDQKQRFCLINAGNANAGMGDKGIYDAIQTCSRLAELTDCPTESVLPFSTGVIGVDLPVIKINESIPKLLKSLNEGNWALCASAILTTDTVTKGISTQVKLDDKTITITGIAKGSGMIRPDMATMLAFIGTDAAINKELLDKILNEVVNTSFNRICVDGDMSTNDACVVIATGKSQNCVINNIADKNYKKFKKALSFVCEFLAKSIVRDGEGATKFVSINVKGGRTSIECQQVAYSIAQSPLVKTALFASDPNWGRILASIGYAGIKKLNTSMIDIYLNKCCIVRNGSRAKEYTEQSGVKEMSKDEICLIIDLNRGSYEEIIWSCDLSYEYIRINAEYRT